MIKKKSSTIKHFEKKKREIERTNKNNNKIPGGKAAISKEKWYEIFLNSSKNKSLLKKSWKSDNPKKEYSNKVKELLTQKFKK
jgi:hypothetical protein